AAQKTDTKAESAQHALMQKLRDPDAKQRAGAAAALATVGFGSLEVEKALLELLDDKSVEVQRAALSSVQGINETYAFFFRNTVTSREVTKKQEALLQEIGRDAARKARFARVLAAQLRLGDGHHPLRADALRRLHDLDAREHLP